MPNLLYKPEYQPQWDAFVREARNATFLLERNFMDYHKDRFEDASLLCYNDKGRLCGLLPANIRRAEGCIESHGGLTYGGWLLRKDTSLTAVREMMREAAQRYADAGAEILRYKPIPHIYHSYPAEEDLYWLFRAEARLVARSVSTAIDLRQPLGFSTLRRRKVRKAQAEGLETAPADDLRWEDFWDILTDVLHEQHQTAPVHSLEEILRLAAHFPEQIRLHTVLRQGRCLAGCVAFDCGETVHIQYIASSDDGRKCGALDFLFDRLIEEYRQQGRHFFDFGISTESGGSVLNEGLLFQKEGFGGRAVCYDTYEINLKKLATI